MAISMYELLGSRPQTLGKRNKVLLKYVLFGTLGDDVAAHAHLIANSPAFYGGLVKSTTDLSEYDGEHFFGTVEYSGTAAAAAGESEFTFDTTGRSYNLTHSLETVDYTPGDAPNFMRGINVGDEGPAGVQLPLPGRMAFEEKHYLSSSFVTPAYKALVMEMSHTVCNGPFKGFAAGEVFFEGARGAMRDLDLWELTYFFKYYPNRENYEAAEGLVLPFVEGWDYVWVLDEKDDGDGENLAWIPRAAYVERIHERKAFSALGIGS